MAFILWCCCCQLPVVAELKHAALTESSGVCVSSDGHLIWTHNDSGDRPRLYAFRRDGELEVVANVPGARAIDWEDICSFDRRGKRYLAIGDVGDNQHRRSSVHIYVLEEPSLLDKPGISQGDPVSASRRQPEVEHSPLSVKLPVVGDIEVTFPMGPVDCEGIAYDPQSQKFLLATKELLRTRLFEVNASRLAGTQSVKASLVGTFLVPMVTGADIAPAGDLLVLCTYGPGCLFVKDAAGRWKPRRSVLQFFELPGRKQGESICFEQDGQGLLLTSEIYPSPLFSVAVPDETEE